VTDLGWTTVLRFPSCGFPDAGYDMVTIPREDFIGNFRSLAARHGQACHPADAGIAIDLSRTTKLDAVREAAKAVYPHGLPSGLTIKERNKALGDYIENSGGTRPSDRTFRRALKQRTDTGQ
jgi:hypothetical protein